MPLSLAATCVAAVLLAYDAVPQRLLLQPLLRQVSGVWKAIVDALVVVVLPLVLLASVVLSTYKVVF